MSTKAVYGGGPRGWLVALALLAPTFAAAGVFLYYPAVRALEMGFYRTRFFGSQRTFVGLDNYAQLLTDPGFQLSVGVTVAFAAVVVVGVMAISLPIAYWIHEVESGTTYYMLATIWPYALPSTVASVILLYLLHPSLGIGTAWLATIGIDFNWFRYGWAAFTLITLVAVWNQIGYNVIFMLAAIHSLPESLTESAVLDGVSRTRRLLWIYVPLISPTLLFLLIMNTIYAFFGTFAIIDITTGGRPGGVTNIIIYDLYRNAFEFDNHGIASAQSVILFVVVGLLMFAQLKYTDRYTHYGT